ncbi:hypothetical protein FKW77_002677 [Venturia effusa]|uniref:Uncharacterized protein n=1 Tax=Venturia effusa TaxID=50376 RepID=A0A517LQU5_9PEZI|nr:hypothetical protein FKW77_002677 [Venturia effusa]
MLLTLPSPAKPDFEYRNSHEFSPRLSYSTQRPAFKADRDTFPALQGSVAETMSGPHRGLPPPSSMTLPDPGRMSQSLTPSFTGMPAPPSQWHGAEESMRNWLNTKAEEEKRKREEEKTKQESYRLEQRKIEQNMLSESIRNGVPPPLVPVIFAGIGGTNLSNLSIEWLQQYAHSLQVAQQQQQHPPGPQNQPQDQDMRRDRLLSQTQQYGSSGQPGQGGPSGPPPPPPQQFSSQSVPPYGYSGAAMSPTSGTRQPAPPPPPPPGGPTSAPRPPLQNVLPRLSTNDQMQAPQGPPSVTGGPVQPSGLHGQAPQEQNSSSSPSIYFHHWVPPTSQGGGGNPPATPSEYASSPKKRRTTIGSQQSLASQPTSEPRYQSTSFVHVSSPASSSTPGGRRGGHKRQLSDNSSRGAFPAATKKTRSRANTESNQADLDEIKRTRQGYPVGGGEDRSDSGSISSYGGPPSAKRSRYAVRSELRSASASPKHETAGYRMPGTSRKNSFGGSSAA